MRNNGRGCPSRRAFRRLGFQVWRSNQNRAEMPGAPFLARFLREKWGFPIHLHNPSNPLKNFSTAQIAFPVTDNLYSNQPKEKHWSHARRSLPRLE